MTKCLDELTTSYDFQLPPELIAQRPIEQKDQSRLLHYNQNNDEAVSTIFETIVDRLPQETILFFNNSKVFPCRLIMNKKQTGGKVEVFFLSLEFDQNNLFQVLLRSSGKKNLGTIYEFKHETSHEDNQAFEIEVVDKCEDTFLVKTNLEPTEVKDFLMKYAGVPIPPYIRDGVSDDQDKKDYQTVYAKYYGSVAAPTAGLHFTDQLLDKIRAKKIKIGFVTLHVGLGTFSPVKSDNIQDHHMHYEHYSVDRESRQLIEQASGNITAVGTTTLRVLESLKRNHGEIHYTEEGEIRGRTNIFLHPPKKVQSIQGLITNFHLPKSSLIMLVSSLVGREKILSLYKRAVEEKFRFFSYGDAMYLQLDPNQNANQNFHHES